MTDFIFKLLLAAEVDVVVCVHIGCVKSYELIKTEDIPNLDNSGFSPRVVKDVAQNILSFLKANATKEGHTYWLFRGWIIVAFLAICWRAFPFIFPVSITSCLS